MLVEFIETTKISDAQQDALKRLRALVYPPEVLATMPGRLFTWAAPQWSIFLWDHDELISRVGLLVRDISANGVIRRFGGIGGVMTHPGRQGQGLASQALQAAAQRFESDLEVSSALLFCRPPLVDFYKRFHWKLFQGSVFVEQPQGKIEFTANQVMLLDVKDEAPLDGVLDLNGLPW